MANSLEAKIVVLGSQGVGKTSFVHRYVKNAFAPPSTQSTIGASFLTKRVIDVDTSTVVRLQIWDTAGQERFRSISKLYYRGTSTLAFPHLLLASRNLTFPLTVILVLPLLRYLAFPARSLDVAAVIPAKMLPKHNLRSKRCSDSSISRLVCLKSLVFSTLTRISHRSKCRGALL
jgi:Ras of Complex, Roc, domain of DAPkinase